MVKHFRFYHILRKNFEKKKCSYLSAQNGDHFTVKVSNQFVFFLDGTNIHHLCGLIEQKQQKILVCVKLE